MTKLYINVGLDCSTHYPARSTLTMQDIVTQLANHEIVVVGSRVQHVHHAHGVERTAVIVATTPLERLVGHMLHDVAQELSQDCIAWQHADATGHNEGALSGPYAHEWGSFDGDYFIKP